MLNYDLFQFKQKNFLIDLIILRPLEDADRIKKYAKSSPRINPSLHMKRLHPVRPLIKARVEYFILHHHSYSHPVICFCLVFVL